MIRKISLSILLCLAVVGGFIWQTLIGSDQINYKPNLTEQAWQSRTSNAEFATHLASFQRIELPLRVRSTSIPYNELAKASKTSAPYMPDQHSAGDALAAMGVDISQIPEVALNAKIPLDSDVETLPSALWGVIYEEDSFVATLVATKTYNDKQRYKQTTLYLVTLNWQGQIIDHRTIGTETIRYDLNNDTIFEQYFMLTFNADLTIDVELKTWRYVDRGGYSTGGWQESKPWQISNAGKISLKPLNQIPRDE